MLNKRILVLMFVVAFLTLLVGCFPGITPSPPKGVIGGRIMAPPGPETTKDITGWIPLANATVTITDSEGVTHTVTTDEDGYYTFTDIAVDANTIITASGTVDGNTVIVKDVIPQAVAADEDYEAGIADAESTALALIVEELLEQGLDPGDIDLEGIQASVNFNEVVEQVDSILEGNGNVTTDPGLTNTVGNVAEDIINPPEPTPEPTPQPTPVFLTSIVVKPKTMTLFVGEPEDIVSVTAHYSNGSIANITLGSCTYASSAPGVATVSVVGLVTAITEGTATITVSYAGKTDTLEVTVIRIPMEIMIVDPLTFMVDAPTEFTIDVVANSDVNKNVRFYFTLPILPSDEYTVELFYDGNWMDLKTGYPFYDPGTGEVVLGGLDGDPLIDEKLTFRGTFHVEGTYETTVKVWTVIPAVTQGDPAEKDVLLYSKFITFEVIDLVQNTNTVEYYHTIQAAIDATSTLAGHTIEVAAGTYDEQVVIDKSLTLQGAGDTTVIQPSGASILITVKTTPWLGTGTKEMASVVFVDTTGAQVTIKDLKIDGSGITEVPAGVGGDWVAGLAYLETSGTIENLTVIGNPSLACRTCGIWASAVADAALVEVTGCSVIGYNRGSIYACGGTLTVDFNYNEIYGPGEIVAQVPNGMFFLEGVNGSATYNTITDLGYTGIGEYRSTGIGTYNAGVDVVFSYNEIFNVQNAFALSEGTIGTIVEYNDIYDCHTGVRIEASAASSIIHHNEIHDNDFAIRCGATMGDGNEAHYNNFVNNLGSEWTNEEEAVPNTYEGAVCNLHDTFLFDARYNWWGNESGPIHYLNPDGTGDTVSDNVIYVLWSTEEEN